MFLGKKKSQRLLDETQKRDPLRAPGNISEWILELFLYEISDEVLVILL